MEAPAGMVTIYSPSGRMEYHTPRNADDLVAGAGYRRDTLKGGRMAQEYQTYTVKGSWPFPSDMLRYDDAKPATGEAADLIERLSGDYAPSRESIRDEVEIRLIRPKRGLPAIDRWQSFDWKVVNGDEDTQYAIAVRNPPPLEPTPYEKLRAAVKGLIDTVDFTADEKRVFQKTEDEPLTVDVSLAISKLTDVYNETPEARHG